MAGTPKEHGPTAERVADAVRRIRQEQGLSYAELARRSGILDTGLMKIEKRQRRVDVDDLMALAVALGVTPNRLLLPDVDLARPGAPFDLAPGMDKVRTDEAWAWAYGERPLGAPPSSNADSKPSRDELAFIGKNRRHYSRGAFGWLGATSDWIEAVGKGDKDAAGKTVSPGSKAEGSGLIAAVILGAFTRYGLDTSDIRQAAESGIIATLVEEEPDAAEETFRQVWAWLMAHGDEED